MSETSEKPQAMMTVIVVDDAAALAERAADWVAERAREAVSQRKAFHVALAGGETPRVMYERLSVRDDVQFSKLHIWFGDERCVPPDHADSNYRMVRESLLERTPIPSANVHRMLAEKGDVEASADAYATALPPELDLIILGMGEDGHTASLFPGSVALKEQPRRVLPVVGPGAPPNRLTVSPEVIKAARQRLVLVTGENKADMVARVLAGPVDVNARPVSLAREGTWIVDKAAAAKLPEELRK